MYLYKKRKMNTDTTNAPMTPIERKRLYRRRKKKSQRDRKHQEKMELAEREEENAVAAKRKLRENYKSTMNAKRANRQPGHAERVRQIGRDMGVSDAAQDRFANMSPGQILSSMGITDPAAQRTMMDIVKKMKPELTNVIGNPRASSTADVPTSSPSGVDINPPRPLSH